MGKKGEAVFVGGKKEHRKEEDEERLPRTEMEEKPEGEPGAPAMLTDITAHRCRGQKQTAVLCVCARACVCLCSHKSLKII